MLNSEAKVNNNVGITNKITIIILAFSTPYLNINGKATDINKRHTDITEILVKSTYLIFVEINSPAIVERTPPRREIQMVSKYLDITIVSFDIGIVNAYLSQFAFSS